MKMKKLNPEVKHYSNNQMNYKNTIIAESKCN